MKRILTILVIMMMSISLVGCGGPQKVSNKQMTLNFSYGDRAGVYTGEVNDQGIPNGKGKFTTKNPKGEELIYEGDFVDGHKKGTGKTTWPSSKQHEEGTYDNDMLNGQGSKTMVVNGQEKTYTGNFENDLPMLEAVGMNTPVSYADWSYSVTGVDTQNSLGNKQANGKYVIVRITDKNNGSTSRQPASNNFFCLIDKTNGKAFKMDTDAALALRLSTKKFKEAWYLSDVNPGNEVSNVAIVFDVPADTDINNLKFIPVMGLGEVAPIQLAQ